MSYILLGLAVKVQYMRLAPVATMRANNNVLRLILVFKIFNLMGITH